MWLFVKCNETPELKLMIKGSNDKAVHCLCVMGFYCFLTGSAGLTAKPIKWDPCLIGDGTRNMHSSVRCCQLRQNFNRNNVCVYVYICVHHVWVKQSQTEELLIKTPHVSDLTSPLSASARQLLSEFAHRRARRGRRCSLALQNKQTS